MSQRRKKPIPLGAALNTPDEDLDMAALVTPEDIEAAKADAVRRMTRRGRALLEAARVEVPPEDDNALSLGS